jgi:hypothetical protein
MGREWGALGRVKSSQLPRHIFYPQSEIISQNTEYESNTSKHTPSAIGNNRKFTGSAVSGHCRIFHIITLSHFLHSCQGEPRRTRQRSFDLNKKQSSFSCNPANPDSDKTQQAGKP